MAKPVGQGDRIDLMGPLQRMSFKSRVVARRESLQLFDVAGRQVFVPLIAFNALYGWSGGDGQTSISWLVGREGNGEKLAPFRADLGPRVFRGLAARLLPTGLRR